MEPYTSFLTWRFDTALQFASGLHHQQPRKGVTIPYIAHLMSVCALVLEAGGDEDQAIAALLHDAVEDQGGLPTLDTIRHMFGDRVANTVESCSDSTVSDPTKKLSWYERKEKYLAHLLSTNNKDALLVAAADSSTMPEQFCPIIARWGTNCGKDLMPRRKTNSGITARWSRLCARQRLRRCLLTNWRGW